MDKVVVVDSGRQFVKAFRNGQKRLFQSVLAEAPTQFILDIKTSTDDLWVSVRGKDYFVGNLAISQSENGIQDRNSDKSNGQNLVLVATACSLFCQNGESITLITNCPARDWGKQKNNLKENLVGWHLVTHKAGRLKGQNVSFDIKNAFVLPEGEMAFYGFVYDQNLNISHPEFLSTNVLVLDIGDQTVNYISMNPGGVPFDDLSGSLDLGMHKAYAQLQQWLGQNDVEISQADLANCILNRIPIYNGRNPVDVAAKLNSCYESLANNIFSQLTSRLKLNRYQHVLFAGGGGHIISSFLGCKIGTLCTVHSPSNGQWLNALGANILFRLK